MKVHNHGLLNFVSPTLGINSIAISQKPISEYITDVEVSPDAIKIATNEKLKRGINSIGFLCLSFAGLSWDEKSDSSICE